MSQPLLVIGAVFVLFVLVNLLVRHGRFRRQARLSCPVKQEQADLQIVQKINATWGDYETVDVSRCNLLDDPDHVTCEKGCIGEAKTATAT